MELDAALTRFQVVDLEYGGGLSNHGPMAAEALVTLGHTALVSAWVDRYAPRLLPLAAGTVIREAEQSAALGRPERAADWVATFEADLTTSPWQGVLQSRIGQLVDGLFAGATHGWLRVAHAVRALADQDTSVRRRELAFGLATWACRYQTLPGEPGSGDEGLAPGEALAHIPLLPESARRPGLFFDAARPLDERPDFPAAVAWVSVETLSQSLGDSPGESPGESLSELPSESEWIADLCRAGARLYLAHPGRRIAYAHTVTAPSALRLVTPYLDASIAARVRGRVFQSVAALHAVSGS